MKTHYDNLKDIALREGVSVFGVADITSIKQYFNIEPAALLEDLQFGISIGYRLSNKVIEGLFNEPTKIYSMHYRRINTLLDLVALKLTSYIQQEGASALPIAASQIIDWHSETAHLSHKMVARLSGLGWIGRSGLLINPTYGSGVRYATVLTNLPIKTDSPIHGDCQGCVKCIEICPAGAIKESADSFDRDACSVQLKKFSKLPGIGQSICGLCIKVCKPGKLE